MRKALLQLCLVLLAALPMWGQLAGGGPTNRQSVNYNYYVGVGNYDTLAHALAVACSASAAGNVTGSTSSNVIIQQGATPSDAANMAAIQTVTGGCANVFVWDYRGGTLTEYTLVSTTYQPYFSLTNSLALGGNTILPSWVTGYHGNTSGLKIPLATNWTNTAGGVLCDDGNGNLALCTTTGTTGSNVVLASNPQINVSASIGTSTGAGVLIPGTSLTAGTAYYMGASALTQAKADAIGTTPAICLAISSTQCLTSGVYRFSAAQSGWTQGNVVYLSDATAGALLVSAPTTSGHIVQRIGVALATDTILVNPSLDVGTIQ